MFLAIYTDIEDTGNNIRYNLSFFLFLSSLLELTLLTPVCHSSNYI
jgi:hypothetical protein